MSALKPRSWFRVRETHVRDHLAPLTSRGAGGVVALDLLLRGLAARTGGEIDPSVTWEALHDSLRAGPYRPNERQLKRKWVSDKLLQLESLVLIRRDRRAGGRSGIIVLSDKGDRSPFDDPGAAGNSYVTILGGVFQQGRVSTWGASEFAAYMAAMIAERYARADPALAAYMTGIPFGGGMWFRPLSWFADSLMLRPPEHIRIPFSERTLRRGIIGLRGQKLMARKRIWTDPRTDQPFVAGMSRILYFNGFDNSRSVVGGSAADIRARQYVAGDPQSVPLPG